MLATLLYTQLAVAQCIIDTSNFELIYPPADKLPCIERNVPYEATIQLFAIPSLGVSIDSLLVTNFLDLPSGITYSFNPTPCKLYPYDHGCVHFTGTTTDTSGVYVLDYNGTVYLQQGNPTFDYLRANFPGSLPEYSVRVIEPGANCPHITTGLPEDKKSDALSFSVYPNPNTGYFELAWADNTFFQELNIFNATGATVHSQKIDGIVNSRTSVSLQQMPRGIYLVHLSGTSISASKTVSVE